MINVAKLAKFTCLSCSAVLFVGSSLPLLPVAAATELTMAQAQSQSRPRIAVLDFDYASTGATGNWWYSIFSGTGPARGVSDLLTNRLVRDGSYSLVERNKIEEVLREQNLGQADRIDPGTAAQIGKILGADYVVIGSITRFNLEDGDGDVSVLGYSVGGESRGAAVQLAARLVNTTTAEIVAVAEGAGTAARGGGGVSTPFGRIGGSSRSDDQILSDAAEDAIAQLAEQLNAQAGTLSALPPSLPSVEALVADVAGNQVIINKGAQDGFRSGMTLSIERVTREVKDPATGEVLRTVTSPVGQIELTEVDARSGVGRIVSGSGFQIGDRAVAVQ